MNATIKKNGLRALITAAILFLLALTFGESLSYSAQEVIGYFSMAVSLIFVFFGVKQYRDKDNEGKISFGKALGMGLLISLFAALGFGVIDFVYTTWINPDFVQEYQTAMLSAMENELSPEEFKIKKEAFVTEMEAFDSPILMALLMFITVMILGFIYSLISGLLLQKK